MEQLQKILPIEKGFFLEDNYDGWLSVIIPEQRDNLVLNPLMNDSNGDNKPENWMIPDGGINPISYAKNPGGPFWTHYYTFGFPLDGSDTGMSFGGTIPALVSGSINGTYTISCWAKSSTNAPIALEIYYITGVTGNVKRSAKFITNDVWTQYSYTFSTGGSTGTSVQARFIGYAPHTIDLAGMQLEKGSYATTFISGFSGEGYKWLGLPFASSSRRLESVITGGRKVNLKSLGMRLTAIDGLGLPQVDHVVTPLAFQYGSLFNCYSIKERDYDMEFTLYATTLVNLLSSRNTIGKAIFSINQPRCFIWQPLNCGQAICDEVLFTAAYKDGFSLGLNSRYGEEIKLSFTDYTVLMNKTIKETYENEAVTAVVHPAIIAVDNYGNPIVLPSFSSISASIFRVRGMVVSPYDGYLYVVVDEDSGFTVRGRVLRYDGTAWTSIARGSSFLGAMTALHAHGAKLYVAISNLQTFIGESPFVGTSGNGLGVINLANNTVSSIGSLISGNTTAVNGSSIAPIIRAITTDKQGNLYIGGNFTGVSSVGSGSTSNYHLARYTSAGQWKEIGLAYNLNAVTGGVRTLYFDNEEGRLWVGGDFRFATPSSGVTFNGLFYLSYITNIDGNFFRPDFPLTSSSVVGEVNAITKYRNRIIIGGQFRSSFGDDADLLDNIAYIDLNQTTGANVVGKLIALGGAERLGVSSDYCINACTTAGYPSQFDCDAEPVEYLSVCNDILYLGGKMVTFGKRINATTFVDVGFSCGTTQYISSAEYAETGFFAPDISFGYVTSLPFTECFSTGVCCGSEKLGLNRFYTTYLLSSPEPTMTSWFSTPEIITLCSGDMPTEPTFFIVGPGKLTEITNQTQGMSLYFDYGVENGELLMIDLNQTPVKITSTLYGNITASLLPASTPSSFKIVPGENSIIVKFNPGTTNAITRSIVQFNRKALSAETLCSNC